MKYRTFGNTAIRASEIGFGLWTLSTDWWGQRRDWRDDVKLLQKAFALGIIFYDTADTYGKGFGEEILSHAFAGLRKELVIATKFGYDFYNFSHLRQGHGELPQDFSPKHVRFACEQSLKRLGTEYIDLYQLHNPRMDAIKRDDLFAELERLKEEGKILAYAVALGPAIGWKDEGLEAMGTRNIAAMHIIYNLFEQDPGRDFFPVAREKQIGLMVRVPHQSGLLEGRFSKDTTFAKGDHRYFRFKADQRWIEIGLQKLEKIKFLYEGKNATIGQMALKFVLAEPSVTTVLPNINTEEQLLEFAAAPECPDITAEELATLDDLYKHNFYLEPQPARSR